MSPELGARACGGESWGWGARATVRDVLSCGISLCCRVCCRAAVLCVLSIVRCARTYIELESTPQAHARPPAPRGQSPMPKRQNSYAEYARGRVLRNSNRRAEERGGG